MKSTGEVFVAVVIQMLWFAASLGLITAATDYVPLHLENQLEVMVIFSGFIMYVAGVLLLARFSYVRLMSRLKHE